MAEVFRKYRQGKKNQVFYKNKLGYIMILLKANLNQDNGSERTIKNYQNYGNTSQDNKITIF